MNSEKYIGLDVHQATMSVAVMDCKGKLVMASHLRCFSLVVASRFVRRSGSRVSKKVNYVLDADISSFFDTLDKGWLVKFRGASYGRSPHPAADPEVVEGRSDGGRQVVGREDRESARLSDFTAPGEYLHY